MNDPFQPDVLIAGAGIIGLSLALELHARGVHVAVLEEHGAMEQTSSAAAGMLAAGDPHNPAELQELAEYSLSLYEIFLRRIERLSGLPVPFQTDTTVQYLRAGGSQRLQERSLDPRQLARAMVQAVKSAGIPLTERVGAIEITEEHKGVRVRTASSVERTAKQLVHASGAWFRALPCIRPRKGQMLRVRIPSSLVLDCVHRAEDIYIVPRTQGPQAGTALIGATDEDAGFDLTTRAEDLARLRARAAELVPKLGDQREAPQVEAWAGLRPATPDALPLLGRLPGTTRQWTATGHYRNGILLAPATAVAMADLLMEKRPAIDLTPFASARFA